jgi:hypothetical protein
MYDWAIGLSVVLSVGLTAYVATIFLGNLLRRGGSAGASEVEALRQRLEELRASTQQSFSTTQMLLAGVQLFRLFNTLLDLVPLCLSIFSMVLVNRKLYFFSFGLLLSGWWLMQNTSTALAATEVFYKCALSPFLNDYFFSFMHLMNLFFGALVPVYNLFVVLLRQLLVGSALVLGKCQTSTLSLMSFVTALVEIFKASIAELLRFVGLTGGISGQNNFIVNTMQWERLVEPTRKLLQFLPESLTCMCAGNSGFLAAIWRFLSYPLFTDELDMIVSHFLNFFVSWFQILLQTVPPFLSYPNFEPAFYHLVAMVIELGRLYDKWAIELFELVARLFKIGGFNLIIEVPELFVFGTLARLAAFLIVLIERLVGILQHLILPFDTRPITDTEFMLQVFSMKKPWAYLDSFVVAAYSSVNFMSSTLLKVFVLVSAMGSNGCQQFPQSCHFYNEGSCAVYCASRSTIVFKDTPFRCHYEVNARARFEFNMKAIESLDRKVFEALDSYDGGFVGLTNRRACLPEWDSTYSYRHADFVKYEGKAYFCKSSRCFFTSLQQQYPDSECGSLVSCWDEIPYSADAECPTVLNQTSASLEDCRQSCNQTVACRAYEHFDAAKYKAEKETLTKQCGNGIKCDFPQCTLYSTALDSVEAYITKRRSPTVRTKAPLQKVFVYAREGTMLRNNTYAAFCEYSKESTVFCVPLVGGIAMDRDEQFEAYSGVADEYRSFAYKSDLFTTEQEVFLPLQKELLSVSVQKSKHNLYAFRFARRNPRNQSELLAEPLEGKAVKDKDFQLGIVRSTYKELVAPDDSFSINAFLSCTGLSLARVPLNAVLVAYEFVMELLWKLIIGGSIHATELGKKTENLFLFRLFDLMYSFDGPWHSRDEEPPCSAALPISAERLLLSEYKGLPYDPYCGERPTMQSHVYANWDKAAFFFSSMFQKDTFGKLIFNSLRLAPEAYRVGTRIVLDLQSLRFVRRLALLPFGCGFSYAGQQGDCTPISGLTTELKPPCPIGFPSADCSCRADDPLLDYNTTCACIWLPSATLDGDLRQTSSIAVSHWCGVNMMEWTLIYFSRITDALKLILDSMQQGTNSFPVTPDLCKVDESDAYTRGGKSYELLDSLVNRVFGGVVVRSFQLDQVSQCAITAEHDFACSFASILERAVKLLLGMIRKLWRNSVSVLSLEPDAVDVDLTAEICGMQKVQAALASTIVELSPGLSKESLATRKGITALIYSFMDILGLVFSEVHLGLLFVRSFLSGNPAILEGGAMGTDEAQNAVAVADMATIFYASMTKFVVIVTTFVKQIFESLAKIGSPDLFLQLRDIVSFLEELITGGIIPIVSQMAYLAIRLLGLIFTPHLIDGATLLDIVTQTLNLMGQLVTVMLSQAMRVLGIILDMMGAFGKLIGSLLKLVCGIQGVLSDLTFGAWSKMDCSGLPTLRRRTLAEKDLTRVVFEEFRWDGDSFCDHFITAYKDWDGGFASLRPIEQLRFQECLEWRLLNEQLVNITGFHSLPHDLVYNWKQPWLLFAKSLQASFVYAQWWLKDGTDIAVLKKELDQTGLPAKDILEAVHRVKRLFNHALTRENAHTLMMNVFRDHDAHFDDPASDSGTHKAYEVYEAVSHSVFGIYDIVSSDGFSRNLRQLEHFTIPAYGAAEVIVRVPKATEIFSDKALRLGEQVNSMQESFGRVYSDLECQQSSADRLFCFECALVDNFLYSTLDLTKDLGSYYDNQFRVDFLMLFNASWSDNSEYNQKYARAFRQAQANKAERYGGIEGIEGIEGSEADEWLEYAAGLILHGNRTLEELSLAVSYWFQGNATSQVPANATLLLPSDFQTVLEFPFRGDCLGASFMWQEKLRSPFYGFLPGLAALAVFEAYAFLVAAPPVLLRLVLYGILSVSSFVAYLVVVYEMNPFCLPQLPPYLLRDLLLWLEEGLFVSCSCSWFPFLSTECTQQTCYSCDATEAPSYLTCADTASGMKELGYFWHYAFFARWQFTETLAWLDSLQLFPFTFLRDIEGLAVLVEQATARAPILGVDLDCFWLGIFVPISEILLVFVLVMALSPLLTWALAVAQHTLLFVFHLVASTVYLAYAASST